MAGDQPLPADENLPEVVPDSSPQVLSNRDAFLANEHLVEKDPKYIADSSPRPEERDLKYAVDSPDGTEPPLVKGDDGVWRPAPVSALSPTDATLSPEPQSANPESAAEEGRGDGGEAKEEKVCGLKKRTFWIVLGVAIVVVLAAIGGGVGGGISARQSRQTEPPPPPEEEDEREERNFLNNGTIPDHGTAFQAFSEPNYGGAATEIITSEGFHDLPFDAISYVWVPNESGCCISFCQNRKNTTQHWCQPRYRDKSESTFPRLGVLCGQAFNREGNEQRCEEEKD